MPPSLPDASSMTHAERRRAAVDHAIAEIRQRLDAQDQATLRRLAADRKRRCDLGQASHLDYVAELRASGLDDKTAERLAGVIIEHNRRRG